MKRFVSLLLLACFALPMSLGAQTREERLQEYKKRRKAAVEQVKEERRQAVALYKERANQDYAERMKARWEYYELRKARALPTSPDPVVPPKVEPGTKPTSPRQVVPDLPSLPDLPPIAPPVPDPVRPELPADIPESYCAVDYYGTQLPVGYDVALTKVSLASIDEQSVSQMWATLADGRANGWLHNSMAIRSEYGLCDWAYIRFAQKAAEALYSNPNEAAVLSGFTLIQSGFNVRLARCGNRLCLLMPSPYPLYSYKYITIDGLEYYVLLDVVDEGLYVYNSIFPEEHLPSMQISLPRLAYQPSAAKTFTANAFPALSVELNPNFNVIEFYDDCPRNTEWQLFAAASLDPMITSQLYPVLRRQIEGKSEAAAANMLINFVQTAFEYKTDGEQFGYERPLYGDETFFYPYSDCEDRSILYAILVRDLLGLDVALLHFKGHLATAVRFNENVVGDYLTIEGVRYLVCDPTYINASIGMMMPDMGDKLLNVILL